MLHEEKVAASSDSFTQKCNIKQLSTLKRIKYNKREKPRASQGNVATCLKLKSKRWKAGTHLTAQRQKWPPHTLRTGRVIADDLFLTRWSVECRNCHSSDPQRVSASLGSLQTHTQLSSPHRLRTFGFIRLVSLQLHDRIRLPAPGEKKWYKTDRIQSSYTASNCCRTKYETLMRRIRDDRQHLKKRVQVRQNRTDGGENH